ncbi:23S rRNA (uracil(1939)-C(5))-methyltransferase RlmD [Candidatus Soleaferrea massiliensis]|uniref:23S rRNA (uracil(1939)-C(5))-methyltransferase RlmD n=1 Tax=Candidatus Soleaferrea massiliensis TaxID=1470354 RepID=UPI00058D0833|nr:23S rRNA (uracil(1939)-C(5))-methyltransferase RlmD [Candidatus Soleaferrea massiliensis]
MVQKNEILELEIVDITEEGNGVAKHDGFAVFIPNTAVGDRAQVRIVKVLSSYAFGRVERLISPSKDRTDPGCAVFGRCGGCTLRHIGYETELQLKYKWVANHLRRIGGIEVVPEPILHTGRTAGYRNKAQYPVRVEDGRVMTGFFAKRSHRIAASDLCDLQPALFEDILKEIRTFAEKQKIPVYDEQTHRGCLRHIYLRLAEKTGQVMVCLVLSGKGMPKEKLLVKRLTARFPQIHSIMVNVNQKKTNVILGDSCRTIYGADYIVDELCGVKLCLSPLTFYQVNRDAAELLYRQAQEYAQLTGEETLLDLYCGAGSIGLSMAHRVKKLIGVEVVEAAVENARQNAKLNGIGNARFFCADASSAAKRLAEEGTKPDVVIVDPPRKGCDKSVIESIVRMAPKRVVMISCNSATAARDCRAFEEMGYQVIKARPVDLFPRTGHVECVVLLTKTEK